MISDIATLIREQFTDEAVVGRVGGDEFMVFVKDTSLQAVYKRAENAFRGWSSHCCDIECRYGCDRKRRV
mgnify:CR=1 FL=1